MHSAEKQLGELILPGSHHSVCHQCTESQVLEAPVRLAPWGRDLAACFYSFPSIDSLQAKGYFRKGQSLEAAQRKQEVCVRVRAHRRARIYIALQASVLFDAVFLHEDHLALGSSLARCPALPE